ncbi:MAG: addiction module toxin RelE [Tepidisphaerales bacterium]
MPGGLFGVCGLLANYNTRYYTTAVRWTFIQLTGFRRLWQSEKLPDEDLQALETAIMRDPTAPAVMKGTGGLRKLRFAPPSRGKGKSGSMRVGFVQFPEFGRIYLVTLFLKKDTDNLSAADRQAIRSMLVALADAIRKGRNP